MFVWAPIPDKFKKLGSMKFAKKLMINADVAVAPGLAFGKNGEGFVRIGLVENTQRIRQAAKNIKKFLDQYIFLSKPGTQFVPANGTLAIAAASTVNAHKSSGSKLCRSFLPQALAIVCASKVITFR